MVGRASSSMTWPALLVWGIVNAVNLLQTVGFLSRVHTGGIAVNHAIGYAIAALAIPAVVSLAGFLHARADVIQWFGVVVFLAFVIVMLVVDYLRPVEFRSPARPAILVPYLMLFFGAIVLMGMPMFRLHRSLWLVTAATTAMLLASMLVAMHEGVA